MSRNETQGRDLADAFRNQHRLGVAPLGDIFEVVHRATGIDVFSMPAGEVEHGFSMLDPATGTVAIAVATTRHPFRQRSSVAHELAHVVSGDLDRPDGFTPGSRSPEEIRADTFARHLLLPLGALRALLDPAREATTADLSTLVQEFQVSPAMVAIQLREAGLITAAVCQQWCGSTAARLAFLNGWHSQYAALAKESEFPRAPQGLVARLIRGYHAGVLGLSELSEWSGQSASEIAQEIGAPDMGETFQDDFWGSDEPLFPEDSDG